jgi:CheY-like chemotaxis protein
MKVLVVDDHPTDLKLISHVFAMSGHLVWQKASSEGVLDLATQDRPDVIVLDLRLPGTDGLALIRQLRGDANTNAIPIVAVTAYPDSYPPSTVLSAGGNACIVKPVDTRQLSSQIERIVLGQAVP